MLAGAGRRWCRSWMSSLISRLEPGLRAGFAAVAGTAPGAVPERRPCGYGPRVIEAPVAPAAPAAKRLAPIVLVLGPLLRRDGELDLTDEEAILRMRMSAARIDRRLGRERAKLVRFTEVLSLKTDQLLPLQSIAGRDGRTLKAVEKGWREFHDSLF
jgi:hypothetical protein